MARAPIASVNQADNAINRALDNIARVLNPILPGLFVADARWRDLDFAPQWAPCASTTTAPNRPRLQCRRLASGLVCVKGLVRSADGVTLSSASATQVTTLPAAFRPSEIRYSPLQYAVGTERVGAVSLFVDTDGRVWASPVFPTFFSAIQSLTMDFSFYP